MIAGRIASLLFIILLATGAAAQAPRTAFERLDLATPQAATAQFVAAWRGRDYPAVFWTLAPASQNAWIQDVQTYRMGRLMGPLPADQRMQVLEAAIPPLAQWDQTDMSWLFDHVMVTAEAVGALPLSLPAQGAAGEPQMRADGTTTIAFGTGAEAVKFRLTRSPGGQWRVSSVIAPGGNPDLPPWGLAGQD